MSSLITEKDFLCKGKSGLVYYKDSLYVDCGGNHLPYLGVDKDLLNLLNEINGDKAIRITSGYRCNRHNDFSWALYAYETGDTEAIKLYSKHKFGKAADFIVNGYETFANLENLIGKFKQEYNEKFWFKVYNVNEGRDFDNKHIFPYVHVQKRDIK